MSTLIPYLTLEKPFEETLAWASEQLEGQGLQIEQTFDLQSARLSHAGCKCPHHGTDQCSCQMVILLVRGGSSQPITLVLHGNEKNTNLSLTSLSMMSSSNNLEEIVRQVLALESRTITY